MNFTRPPVRILVPAALIAIYFWLVFASTVAHLGHIGPNYNAVGTDYMVFHAAAQRYFEGHTNSIFDPASFTAYLNKTYRAWLTEAMQVRPWVYPPGYLLIMLPFGLFGFIASYTLFEIATLAALAAAISTAREIDEIGRRWITVAALVSPAAATNVILGQNAFLIAAILVAGVSLLGRRPLLAGAILGLSSVKPQFAILLPFALMAARNWKALFAAVASSATLALASALTFGWIAWQIWFAQTLAILEGSFLAWIEFGRLWGNSVWTCAVLLGASPAIAFALEVSALLMAIAAVGFAFSRTANPLTRLTILLPATLFAAPHWMTYDMVLLTLAGLFWMAEARDHAREPLAWLVMLVLWIAPLFSPVVLVPFARVLLPLIVLGFMVLSLSEAHFALGRRHAMTTGQK